MVHSDGHLGDNGRCPKAVDWTQDDEGRSNSSDLFLSLVGEVERLIRNDAHALLNGRVDQTARLVVAQLAHVHGLGPLPDGFREHSWRVEGDGEYVPFHDVCEECGLDRDAPLSCSSRTDGAA